MSVLSEWDIIKELGRRIFIHPFQGKERSIRGCCLCLTASEYAYTFIIDSQSQEKKTKRLNLQTDSEGKIFFETDPKKTTVVWTSESVLLKDYFCGTIHSKVKLVSQGIGHLGTRVNPNYGGIMAIALHNLSEEKIKIYVGETIAYLRIHKLNSKSSFSQQTDDPGKISDAIPEGFPTPVELKKWINEELWRKGDKVALEEVLQKSSEYKEAKKTLDKKSILYRFIWKFLPQWEPIAWLTLILVIIGIIQALPVIINLFEKLLTTSPDPKQNITIPTPKDPQK